jgi:transcription-repair coupling factor (superfamily II helicase)
MHQLKNIWTRSKDFDELKNLITLKQDIKACGLASLAAPSFLSAIAESIDKPILYVSQSSSLAGIHKLVNQTKRLTEDESKLLVLPSAQVSPLEDSSDSATYYSQFSEVLSSWSQNEKKLTICNFRSLCQTVCSPISFEKYTINLHKGAEVNLSELIKKLVLSGYERVDTVVDVGTFALRGEVFDVYPANNSSGLPLRINFFGDEIETIKPFEPWNQRSISSKEIMQVVIAPVKPFSKLGHSIEQSDKNRLMSLTSEIDEAERFFWIDEIDKIDNFSGINRLIPVIEDEVYSPLEFFPKDGLLIIDEPTAVNSQLKQFHERIDQELEHKCERKLLPISAKSQYENYLRTPLHSIQEIEARNKLEIIFSDNELLTNRGAKVIDLKTALVPQFRSSLGIELKKFIDENLALNHKIIFFVNSDTEINLKRDFEDLFNNANIEFWAPEGLDRGFAIGHQILLTEFELFNKKAVIGQSRKSLVKPEDFIPIDLDSIRIGDYVVHLKQGIGRFIKMRTIELNGQQKEYITLEYANGDLLNVPVEQMNLLSLYKGSSEGQNVKLSKLGGIDWEKAKTNARTSVKKVAEDLMQLYAKRIVERGFNFGPDSLWQTELEDSFPYKETPDQLRATEEIKRDMENDQTMDRLLCGDVGFGKTEVIIRAAFKAIMAGKQVALLAPTTVLAQQHFRSFKERYEKFPVKLELMIGSLATAKKKEIFEKVTAGEIEMVIGTHAILTKSLKFKDLGMIVIDEEQKFGVNHKEKLKALKTNVAVLTVSATPIPRTMHMALSGIREMSLISTPPQGRVPIKTQMAPNEPKLIRSAILRELERGGQVFYLHNRVESIQNKAIELMQLIPEASYRIAHGKMKDKEISEVMEAFMNHEFDVLIATSIIENGIDVPNANTMIIEDAHKFGLAQLYQLRGRVGRSNDPSKPGHALLIHPQIDTLTEQSKLRLETISRYSNLGAGYQIALRDMEIRGIGNLLGAEQHGKMVSIGYELYCDMLNEAIQEIKVNLSESPQESKQKSSITKLEDKPVFDLKLNAFIPIDWITDDTLRLKEYQRLAGVNSRLQLDNLLDEWKDRFGEVPAPAKQLARIVKLRILGTEAGIVGLVRPVGSFIEMNAKITFDVWRQAQNKLAQWIQDKLAVRFPVDQPYAKIMIKTDEISVSEQLDLMEDLFIALS